MFTASGLCPEVEGCAFPFLFYCLESGPGGATGTAVLDHELEAQGSRWQRRKVEWIRNNPVHQSCPSPRPIGCYVRNKNFLSGISYYYLVSVRTAGPIHEVIYQV